MQAWLQQRRKTKTRLAKAVGNEQDSQAPRYVWYRDKKIIGTVLLLVAVALQIFAFLEVPFFTTIHGYTIGMLFGYYNPFFYLFVIVVALRMILGRRFTRPLWVRVSPLTYWLFVIFFIFLVSSLSYYQVRTSGWTKIGVASWDATTIWFADFRTGPWYAPTNTNGGVTGAVLYAFFAMCLSGIGALLVAVLSLLGIASYVGYRTYKSFIKRKKGREQGATKKAINQEAGHQELARGADSAAELERDVKAPSLSTALQERTGVTRATPLRPAVDATDLPFDDPFADN